MTKFNRAALQCSAATFALSLAMISGPAALAQTTAAAPEAESIIVTGSRIARPDLEGNAPVAIVGAEEIALKGAVNVEEILYEMPQVYPSTAGQSNNPGDGAALLDLRGLGANRTLVLVNGRRWFSYDVTQVVDLNTIPAGLIERVDILTGGRSAIYGSDAVAGVVNFTLKQNFEGVDADASYRITGKGDGGTFSTNVAIGGNFADGRGNATVYVNYTKRDAILQGAREFSRRTISDDFEGGFFYGGSGSVPGTRYQVGRAFFTGAYPDPVRAGNNLFLVGGDTRAYSGATDAFNYAPDNYLQLPQERWLLGASAHFEVNDHLDVYTELAYVNNRVPTQLASTPISGNFRISANNAFLSAATRAAFATIDANQVQTLTSNTYVDAPNDGFVTLSIGRRMEEVGPRISSNERQAFRTLIGARGEISGDWAYDTYYTYARTTTLEEQFGNVSRSRFAQAVAGCPTGSASGCAPANIFGAGAMDAASAAFVAVDTKNATEITEQVFNAAITNGNLFNLGLGADSVGLAVGVEWRSSYGAFKPDFILSSGDVVGFNGGQPTAGGYNVKEVFGEINVPIVADAPFAHRLEVNGAARYSDYSNNTGGVFTWAAGALWAPIPDITIRGGYQRSIRAPTVNNLFAGQSEGFPGFVDYCRSSAALTNATLNQSCRDNGVPASLVGTQFGSGNSQIRAIFGGNPELEAETSDTFSIGTVIQPSFAPGLSLTVDYYDIKVENAILASLGATNIRDACFGTAENNYQPFDRSFCSLIPRDAISYEVDRLQNTAANAGFFKTRGVDFELRYGVPLGFGVMGAEDSRLNFRVSGTYLLEYTFNAIASIPDLITECEGKFGATCGAPYSKWRGNASVSWLTGPATLQVRANYLSGADDDGSANDVVWQNRLPSYVTFDVSAGFDINENFRATFGINNIGDRTPPLLSDLNNEQANTYPTTYDVLGRRFFVGANVKF